MTRRYRLTATLATLAALGFAPAGCLVPVQAPDATPSPGFTPPPAGVFPNGQPPGGVPGALGALRNAGATTTHLNLGESAPLAQLFLNDKNLVPTDGVVWTSSADAIVSVNPTSGVARGMGKGTAIITVTLQADPSVKAQVTVNVADASGVRVIRVNPSSSTVAVGDGAELRAEVELGTGEIKSNVVWSSSDESIAKVSADGKVTGVKVGTAQILAAYADDPNYKGQAFVRVVGTRAEASNAPASVGPTAIATAGTAEEPGLVAVRKPGTWVEQASGTTESLSYVRFFDAKNGVAAGTNVLLQTNDSGTTWRKVGTLKDARRFLYAAPADGWVVTDSALLQAGNSAVAPLYDFQAKHGVSIADVVRVGKSEGYMLANDGSMWETDDGGKSWSEIPTTGGGPKVVRTPSPTPTPKPSATAAPAATPTPTPEATATPTPEPTATPAAYGLLAYNFQNSWSYGGLAKVGGKIQYYATHSQSCKNWQTNGYYTCSEHFRYDGGAGGWTESKETQSIGRQFYTSAKEGWRFNSQGGMQRTVDGGNEWLQVELGDGVYLHPYDIAVSPDGKTLALIGRRYVPGAGQTGGGIAISENNGRTWTMMDGEAGGAVAVVDWANLWVVGDQGKIRRYVVL